MGANGKKELGLPAADEPSPRPRDGSSKGAIDGLASNAATLGELRRKGGGTDDNGDKAGSEGSPNAELGGGKGSGAWGE